MISVTLALLGPSCLFMLALRCYLVASLPQDLRFALAFSVALLPPALCFTLAFSVALRSHLARFAHANFALTKIFEKKSVTINSKCS